ncbi:MAG: thioredoxin-disulfide reductase [Bacteroidia bacterium]
MRHMQKIAKVVILGSGPAGYTAALYAARAMLEPILVAGPEIGGQLTKTSEVENYPGYVQGVLGSQMMEDFRVQAERFGTQVVYDVVVRAELEGQPKKLYLAGGDVLWAQTVIIATGASAKWLGLEAEKRLYGAGVSACAVCDGYFYRGKEVAVVGGGDTACEEALYLSKLCTKVHMLVRREQMRASLIMQQRVRHAPNIQIHWQTVVEDILGENAVERLVLRHTSTGEVRELAVSAIFISIGHHPNTEIFQGQLQMDPQGYIITQGKTTHTSVEGVFAAGDVQDPVYRQAVTAAGTGCMAALDAERWLAQKEAALSQ